MKLFYSAARRVWCAVLCLVSIPMVFSGFDRKKPEFSFTVEGFLKRHETAVRTLDRLSKGRLGFSSQGGIEDYDYFVESERDNERWLVIELVAKNSRIVLNANNRTRRVQGLVLNISNEGSNWANATMTVKMAVPLVVMAIEDPLMGKRRMKKRLGEVLKMKSRKDGIKYSFTFIPDESVWFGARPLSKPIIGKN